MKLYESAEDYLETILILAQQLEHVHAVDIARHLNFTKASVSIAMHKLKDNGYITIASDGSISLKTKGKKIATAVYDRHLIISKLLIDLGVPKDIALDDACKIEHDISEETFEALKKKVK